jgi:hypothetical protein
VNHRMYPDFKIVTILENISVSLDYESDFLSISYPGVESILKLRTTYL